MQERFNIIKPNLYTHGKDIYFSMNEDVDYIEVSKTIDNIVKENIGELKVKESALNLIKEQVSNIPHSKSFEISLAEYLTSLTKGSGFTNDISKSFGIGYIVDSNTMKIPLELYNFRGLKEILQNPEVYLELERESEEKGIILNKEATLKKFQEDYEMLNDKMPENFAIFDIFNLHHDKSYIGIVKLDKVKAKNDKQINKTKKALIKKLKKTEGACLSLDAPDLLMQAESIFFYAGELKSKYGDILMAPYDWHQRLFKK